MHIRIQKFTLFFAQFIFILLISLDFRRFSFTFYFYILFYSLFFLYIFPFACWMYVLRVIYLRISKPRKFRFSRTNCDAKHTKKQQQKKEQKIKKKPKQNEKKGKKIREKGNEKRHKHKMTERLSKRRR